MNGWLIALLIVGGLAVLAFLIIRFGFIGAYISFEGKLTIHALIFGFHKPVFPRKKRAEKRALRDVANISDPKKLLKAEEKRRKKAEKEAERQRKKQAKKKQSQPKTPKDEPKLNPKETLDMVLAILQRAYALTKGKLQIDFHKLHLRIATGDAASTALLYGAATQSAAYLLQWPQDHFNTVHRNDGDIAVEADFLSQKSSLEIDISLQVRGLLALRIWLGLLRSYHLEKKRAQKHAKKRIAKQTQEPST